MRSRAERGNERTLEVYDVVDEVAAAEKAKKSAYFSFSLFSRAAISWKRRA
jgi:hypothetical protein